MSGVLVNVNDTVLLISEDGKRFYTRVRSSHRQHTHQGIIEHDDRTHLEPHERENVA